MQHSVLTYDGRHHVLAALSHGNGTH